MLLEPQREMWSGDTVGADSRWMWAVRILALGFAALATAHLIEGIIRRNVIGVLFPVSVTVAALALSAYGAILGLLDADKRMKLGLVLAGGLGAAKFLSTIPFVWPQLYAYITGLFGVRAYSAVGGPGARYLKPIAVLNLVLTVTATMAYRTMERRSGDWRILLWGIVIVVLYAAGDDVSLSPSLKTIRFQKALSVASLQAADYSRETTQALRGPKTGSILILL